MRIDESQRGDRLSFDPPAESRDLNRELQALANQLEEQKLLNRRLQEKLKMADLELGAQQATYQGILEGLKSRFEQTMTLNKVHSSRLHMN